MATSFPYLKIARERRIPYGVVIRLVQEVEDGLFRYPNYRDVKLPLLDDVCDAMREEEHRRWLVEQCK